MIGTFTSADLLKYTESLLKETKLQELRSEGHSNYGWLKAKQIQSNDDYIDTSLEQLRPIIQKMTPESCAAVAVKLDIQTEQSTSVEHILSTLRTLLREQDNMIIVTKNMKRAKETKKKVKVYPVLAGREPTVSFIVQYNKI